MKKNIALATLVIAALTQSTFAQAAGKILPADASNVKVASASLEPYATGEKLIADGEDGPVYDLTYTTMLNVVVTYDSKDPTDDATALDNSNDPSEVVVGGPTLSFELAVSDAEIAAIQAKKLDATTLVSLTVSRQDVTFNNPVFTDACRFNNDSAQPENPSCIKNVYTTESRPVLSISHK